MATAEARAQYPMVLDEDWETLGYTGLPKWYRLERSLQGEVHDIFRYTVPGRAAPIWTKQTPGQYRVIETTLSPVFKLATKFLLCPASLDWFYYFIYGPRTLTDPPIKHNGEDVHQYHRDDTPMNERHSMARAALQRLAKIHTIEFEGDDEGGTWPSTDEVNVKDDSSSTGSGVGPKITISRDFVRQFTDMCMEGSKSKDRMYTLATKMAMTWIHEIAHGAGMASSLRLLGDAKREVLYRAHAAANPYRRDPKGLDLNEDLFENETLAEPGYSWENYVFGGTVDLRDLNPDLPLVVVSWPNFLKGVEHLRKGGWKRSVTVYIVPKAWVLNVTTQKWWDKVEKKDDTALYIKKIIGFRSYRSSKDMNDDGNTSDSSESRWPTDAQRSQGRSNSTRVSRIRPGVTTKDPSGARANELTS